MQKINFQDLPNTTTPVDAQNLNAIQTNVETAINIFDLFNDTTGTDWQEMLKNKLDYCISYMDSSKENTSAFINGGWAGVNFGLGVCSKIGNTYQLIWHSDMGNYYCRKVGNIYSYNILDGNIYNSNEKVIGQWTDGKPIYRKIISNFTTVTGGSQIGSVDNIDKLINIYGGYSKTGDNNLPINFYIDGTFYIRTWLWTNIVYYDCQGYTGYNGNIIIEYTKTTD